MIIGKKEGIVNMSDIEAQIQELVRKADNAQRNENYEAMREYDKQIEILQRQQIELFKSIIVEQEEKEKPKTM